ncbi:ABC transporter ATP-binding protein [Ktedonospora formicarum]|uniref:ABC transporter ATP-binding protein n=1 Tax=Ktedonospora formicarum TaxID=2778364 RepID=A0A8J3I271_9CHLR|nr:ABC transporter ATP-binding protein [Ktedonospora formicarum]GHO47969.1 ABC transporter ATP-binding protein [Ktedonospora formicarum]
MSNVIEVHGLTKTYGDVTVVDNVSFSVEPEKIYGLLGRNGAGKTTIMQILTAQTFATSGMVSVFGEQPYENSKVLNQICFVKESQKYPDHFRVSDILDLAVSFFPNWDRAYAYSLVEEFNLPPKRRIKALSRGMSSALGIIVGLASRAPLTLFDEPYLGLDPVARSIFYDRLIEDYAEYPRTIVLSTHLIDEVSRLLEHVLVIDQGRLIIDEETDALREQAFTLVGSASKIDTFTADKQTLGRKSFGSLAEVTILGHLDASERRNAEALGLELAPVSLQQLVVHLTGKSQIARKAVEV